MKFRKISASKYVGENGYSLFQGSNGLFTICRNSHVMRWGTGFRTVRSAEIFLEQHDYINATSEILPISDSDLNFVKLVYGATLEKDQFVTDTFILTVPKDFDTSHKVILKANAKEDPEEVIDDVEKLLLELDELVGEDVFSSVIYRGVELRPIIARRENRSARDITRNLVRVRSSNMWAYGVEIKDNDAKVGDVYIQFKGPNGGPGDIYKYYEVTLQDWRRMLSAPSKGHMFWKLLRNRYYYSKMTGDKKGKLPNAIN